MGQKGKEKPSRKLVGPRAVGSSCLRKSDAKSGKWALDRFKTGSFEYGVCGGSGSAVLQGLGGVALERTEGICFVAKYNLEIIFSVSCCCFSESLTEVKSMPGL